MKSTWVSIIAGLILPGLALAQNTPPSSPENQNQPQSQASPAKTPSTSSAEAKGSPRIAPGSIIPVQLTKTIDAKKLKQGDPVEAKVTQDMKTGSGEVIVPKDTKVIGHVTEAQPRTKEQKESQVGIAFDHAVMKGEDVELPMSIQAVVSQASLHPENQAASGAESTSAAKGGGMPAGPNGRPGSPGAQPSPSPTENGASGDQGAANEHAPITANTQGVVGISDLKLSAPSNSSQGSVLTSEKNNVKLDSGTLILLRVNPENGH